MVLSLTECVSLWLLTAMMWVVSLLHDVHACAVIRVMTQGPNPAPQRRTLRPGRRDGGAGHRGRRRRRHL